VKLVKKTFSIYISNYSNDHDETSLRIWTQQEKKEAVSEFFFVCFGVVIEWGGIHFHFVRSLLFMEAFNLCSLHQF